MTNTGASSIVGDVGVSPGSSITGFPPGTVTGTLHHGDAAAQEAQADASTSFHVLAGMTSTQDLTGQNLGGMTLLPGTYSFNSSADLTGGLILDHRGNPDALFVFQIGSTLLAASGATVLTTNGGNGCNVFWQVGSSATLGTRASFLGNILADQSITLNNGATIGTGRALALNGAVTLDTNYISIGDCPVVNAPACGLAALLIVPGIRQILHPTPGFGSLYTILICGFFCAVFSAIHRRRRRQTHRQLQELDLKIALAMDEPRRYLEALRKLAEVEQFNAVMTNSASGALGFTERARQLERRLYLD